MPTYSPPQFLHMTNPPREVGRTFFLKRTGATELSGLPLGISAGQVHMAKILNYEPASKFQGATRPAWIVVRIVGVDDDHRYEFDPVLKAWKIVNPQMQGEQTTLDDLFGISN